MEKKRIGYNHPKYKDRRKELRNGMTKAEIELWSHLKNDALDGRKFRRQYGVDHYILDFYCPSERLAIELDGSAHASEEAFLYDRERDDYLKASDIEILRFENKTVFESLDWILGEIRKRFKD